MPILIECPSCHKRLRVQDATIGKRVKCPNCMTVVTAQLPGPPAPAPPAAPTRPPIQPPREQLDEEVVDYEGDSDRGDADDERRRRKKKKTRRAAERVKLPAIFQLILGILGVLLLLLGVILSLAVGGVAAVAAADIERQQQQQKQKQPPFGPGAGRNPQNAQQQQDTAEMLKKIVAFGVVGTIIMSIVGALLHGLIIFGSITMLKLKSFGLSVTASILCMLSGFASCFGGFLTAGALFAPCACVSLVLIPVYLGVGIWALVVLLSADVKSAFG